MKYSKFINFKAISKELTGQPQKIRQTGTAQKYVDILDNLDDFIEIWLKQSRKQLDKKLKPNTKRNTSGLRRGKNH